jgi:hypothetical protein
MAADIGGEFDGRPERPGRASSDRKSEDDGGQRAEFVADSLLEEGGFEPSVPLGSTPTPSGPNRD